MRKFLTISLFGLMFVSIYWLTHKRSQPITLTMAPKTTVSQKLETVVVEPMPVQIQEKKASLVNPMAAPLGIPHDLTQDLKEQMKQYANFKKIIIKNESDKKNWENLLKNPHAIYRTRKILLFPSDQQKELQEQALDFLIEAVRTGDINAIAALEAVVKDRTIEDTTQAQSVRQYKAELKALALYEWSSYRPEDESHLEGLLPGTVSKKIWSNILNQQALNIAESESNQ